MGASGMLALWTSLLVFPAKGFWPEWQSRQFPRPLNTAEEWQRLQTAGTLGMSGCTSSEWQAAQSWPSCRGTVGWQVLQVGVW